ncbi:MAG: type II toxin-antitoxin system HipA family toxin [Bacteroidales bacterium]|nr:type II toxin-antitoxin system HipA family toxin [Bacteroidales bacterium]
MDTTKLDIWVYAHWIGMPEPKCIGILSAHFGKGRKSFSFEYDPQWISSEEQLLLDPDLGWYSGTQFPNGKDNFGIFLDSMPDSWGRTLMQRREPQRAKEEGRNPRKLHDIDFLLGVYDESRMGALRFKLDPNGPFLETDSSTTTPPWTSLGELQKAVKNIESDDNDDAIRDWILMLLGPGSSLGGARPKANFLDKENNLWIAKFPSKNDTIDKAAWEFLANRLALRAGINMSDSKISIISGNYNTFITKRFDRVKKERIHFASAMTMTGYSEEALRDKKASYLEIAEFIKFSGADNTEDLHQLWKRIVFNISVSNTDDHLRNHGFLLTNKGWKLSPAYDINPSTDKYGLALNIDMDNNALDFDLAKSVGDFFMLNTDKMEEILEQVKSVIKNWRSFATVIGIPRQEQDRMESAFQS